MKTAYTLLLVLSICIGIESKRIRKLPKSKKSGSRYLKLELTKQKLEKQNRKLFADAIAKLIMLSGIRAFPTLKYEDISAGNTNIAMSKEDPFVVINTYPVNQATLDYSTDQVNLPYPPQLI